MGGHWGEQAIAAFKKAKKLKKRFFNFFDPPKNYPK
jgi:hypothetical protein